MQNPKALAPALKRLRRLDKAIARSRNVHGRNVHSNRKERLYCRRRRLHARVTNIRNDAHHKATTMIAKSAGRVVIEDLNVAGMMLNRRLAKALVDAGIADFLQKLSYKCLWYGAELIEASRWFPSSKLCSRCSVKNESLTLSDRRWTCPNCGATNNIDLNAAVNLKKAGFELPGQGRGDCVSPATPAVVYEAPTKTVLSSTPHL